MIRESHYGDVVSESRGAASDSNSSFLSSNTHIIATVTLSISTPVHLVPSHSGWWGPGDTETGEINLYSIEVGG